MRARGALLGVLLAIAAAPTYQCTATATNNVPVNTTGPYYPTTTCSTTYGCQVSCPYGCVRCVRALLVGLWLGLRAARLCGRREAGRRRVVSNVGGCLGVPWVSLPGRSPLSSCRAHSPGMEESGAVLRGAEEARALPPSPPCP